MRALNAFGEEMRENLEATIDHVDTMQDARHTEMPLIPRTVGRNQLSLLCRAVGLADAPGHKAGIEAYIRAVLEKKTRVLRILF